MKKILFLFTFLSFILATVHAQEGKLSLGLKGGLNIARVSNLGGASYSFGGTSASVKNSPRIGAHGGVYAEFKFADAVSLQPEVLFTMKGYSSESKASSGGTSTTTKYSLGLSYIEIPVQLRVNIKKIFILGGPSFGFLMSAKSKSKSEVVSGGNSTKTESTSTDKDGFSTMEVGMYLGLGYQLESGLNFSVRWNKAFTSLVENSGSPSSNSVLQISVGYRLLSK